MPNQQHPRGFPANHCYFTENGFLNLKQILKHFETHSTLGIACCVDGTLFYKVCTRADVEIYEDETHSLISFESTEKLGSRHSRGNGVNFSCSSDQQLWARTAATKKNTDWECRPEVPPLSSIAAADALLFGKREGTAAAQFLATFKKGDDGDGAALPLPSDLGLDVPEKVAAFLVFFGYFIGEGTLDGTLKALVFKSKKVADSFFLSSLFLLLDISQLTVAERGPGADGVYTSPLPAGIIQKTHFEIWSSPHPRYLYAPAYWKFFSGLFGHLSKDATCREEALKAAEGAGGRLPSFSKHSSAPLSEQSLRIAAYKPRNGEKTEEARRRMNREEHGVFERICSHPFCEAEGKWQPLNQNFYPDRKDYHAECKKCRNERARVRKRDREEEVEEKIQEVGPQNDNSEDTEEETTHRKLPEWIFKSLTKPQKLSALAGLKQAAGRVSRENFSICSPSLLASEQIIRLFTLTGETGLISVHGEKGKKFAIGGKEKNASRDCFFVNSSTQSREASPRLYLRTNCKEQTFEGTIWRIGGSISGELVIVRGGEIHKGVTLPSRGVLVFA